VRQLACLDYYRGKWRLMTGNSKDPIRQWTEKYAALLELADEGWKISGPHPKKPLRNADSRWELRWYSLERLLH
jgi:hypothetical protein